MVKKEPIYGRFGQVEGNEINSHAEFKIWTAESGDDLLEDQFGNKGRFGLYYDNAEETDLALFVSDDKEEVRKLGDDFIEADQEYHAKNKAKPKLPNVLDVSHDLTREEQIKRLIEHRKKMAEKKASNK